MAADVDPAPDAPAATEVETVIVTGTRTTGMKAVDSPAPITVLGNDILKRTGQPDMIQALAQNVPSFNAQAFGGDTAALTLSAKLRGISPNHTLVLLNGKRRHGTANLAVLGGAYQGGAAADLNFIPLASVDHVEVLLEGAAAQYGTDAIAGVINIIQKKATSGGEAIITGGGYQDGGGTTGDFTANIGMAPTEKSYLNLTGETKYHGYSFRGAYDPRVVDSIYNAGATNSPAKSYPQVINAPNWPYVNRIAGDAQYRQTVLSYNAGYEITPDIEAYSFGTIGRKWSAAHENYRLPNVVKGKMAGDIAFPLGFDPKESITETDYAVSGGVAGKTNDWNWDLSSTYGKDDDSVNVLNTANASLYADTSTTTTKGYSPNNIHAGGFINTQWSNTLDISHDFDVGMAGPLTFATGVEYRKETYEITPGEKATYYGGGSQSYFGFAPVNAGKHKRNNKAIYADLALSPIEPLKLDAAVRYEDFSDFGDTTVAKLTGRYDFSPAVAVRGTVSTGFRAPTLAEEYYSGINVSPSSISGQLPPNSPGATLLGINGLKPEKSNNFSIGFVTHLAPKLTMTLDAYQITIKNRIVGSGTLYGENVVTVNVLNPDGSQAFNPDGSKKTQKVTNGIVSPAVIAALTANGVNIDPSIRSNATYSVGASMFVNGLDTRTRGVDFVSTYYTDFDAWGRIDWSLSASYNKTEVTKIAPNPSGLDSRLTLFDAIAIANLETTSPKFKIIAGGLWTMDKWAVNLKETVYGKASGLSSDSGSSALMKTTVKTALITDLDVSYTVIPAVKLSVGANNLLNRYPNRINGLLREHYLKNNSNGYVTQFPSFSPFGINGGYYYGKITYSF
ncbi:TonB-dependent receptor plug domain-containing protein [Caulobacter sp. LARHSG274]